MNYLSIGSKGFAFLLCASLVGCASSPAKPKTETSTDAKPVAPQDSANIDIQHDHTSYKSSFSTATNRTQPMLFLAGDSTVHNHLNDLHGWGDVIGKYFDTNKIRIENHALAGRSSRTFITQGWWDKTLATARPGDFVMIQLGTNDGGPIDDTNRARGSIPGLGEETKEIFNPITKQPETVHTYGWYLRKFISDARAKGMTPILCSPVPHVPKAEVKAGDVEKSDYVRWSGEVATNENVPFVNINQISMSHYAGMSPEEIKAKYFTTTDNTHSSLAGAELNAQSVVKGLQMLTNCPLAGFLKP